MSLAAKCTYYEWKKNKISPSDFSSKSKCSEVNPSSYSKRFLKKKMLWNKVNVIHIEGMYLTLIWLVGFCGFLAFVVFYFWIYMHVFVRGIDICLQSVPTSPFLSSENSISGHLLKSILPLYLLDLCFTTFSMTVTVLRLNLRSIYMVTRCMLPNIYTLSTIFIFFCGGGGRCILPKSRSLPVFYVNPNFAYL